MNLVRDIAQPEQNGLTRPILELSGLRLGYGRRTVLKEVSLEVRGGEFWFFIGPNGQGKTTLLRSVMGSLAALGGRIEVRGPFQRHDQIGFVPQQCAMNPALPTTVREFVLMGLVGIRVPRRDRLRRLAWALEKVELAGKEREAYWSLSGGQRQRTLVARALVRRPKLLIADEPTRGMDLSVETSLLTALAELNRSELLTVIIVMHDLTLAARYGTHFALVHDGRVLAGAAEAVLTPENLQRAYGVPVAISHDESNAVSIRLGGQETTRD